MNLEWTKEQMKRRLSKERYVHSLGVASQARILAARWSADKEKAYYAGLVHDVCKELTKKVQLEYLLRRDANPHPTVLASPKIYHAFAARVFLQEEWGITDEDILNAVQYHTTARAGMSLLEEIIYLADLTSADRTFQGVESLRKISLENRVQAMRASVQFSLGGLVDKIKPICFLSFEAYNFYAMSGEEPALEK